MINTQIALLPKPILGVPKPILNILESKSVDFLFRKLVPGLHLLLNALIDLAKNKNELAQFENLFDYKDLSSIEVKDDFKIKVKACLVTCKVEEYKEILRIDTEKENVDWCLDRLKFNEPLEVDKPSKNVYAQLNKLKSEYEISEHGVSATTRIITSSSKPIEIIRENLVRLISLYPKQIRSLLRQARR